MSATRVREASVVLLALACGRPGLPVAPVPPCAPIAVASPTSLTLDADSLERAPDAEAASTYASLEDACAHVVDPEPPGRCTPEGLSVGAWPEHAVALLRMEAWEKTFALLALQRNGRWTVGHCELMIEDSVSSLHTRKSAVRATLGAEESFAMRYVTLLQVLEPSGVGVDGNGDGEKVKQELSYEDHLVVINAATGECTDTAIEVEKQPGRVIEYRAAMDPRVPNAWRAKFRIRHDAFWGFRLE